MSKEQKYKDIDLDFSPNPLTGDLTKKTGLDAIRQSLRNIVQYSIYEKPYNKEFDIGVKKLLFENKGSGFREYLQSRIRALIIAYEPRVLLNAVSVTSNMDDNSVKIKVFYTPIETQTKDSLELFLGRYL
jgi:phage baseplate assembly protein W